MNNIFLYYVCVFFCSYNEDYATLRRCSLNSPEWLGNSDMIEVHTHYYLWLFWLVCTNLDHYAVLGHTVFGYFNLLVHICSDGLGPVPLELVVFSFHQLAQIFYLHPRVSSPPAICTGDVVLYRYSTFCKLHASKFAPFATCTVWFCDPK